MKPIRVPDLAPEQLTELEELYRSTRSVRLRTRAQMVLLYLPTYSPWLNPIEMLWRHFRREVTHNLRVGVIISSTVCR